MSTVYPSPSSIAFENENEPVWFLKERVVVTWHDTHSEQALYLGEPSPLNKDANLVLWIGLDGAKNRLAVMLQLTVTHYVSTRRKRFEVFLVPAPPPPSIQDSTQDPRDASSTEQGPEKALLQLVDETIPVLSIEDMPAAIAHMFQSIQGSSKNRFLRLSLRKPTRSQTLMPARTSHRPVQGAAAHILLSAKAFTDAAERFEVYIGYSSYAHQALKRHISALRRGCAGPEVHLQRSYNSNGGGFDLWDGYLDAKRKGFDAELDADSRHVTKRKRAGRRDGEAKRQKRVEEEQGPPPYVEACEIQVSASDVAASPLSARLDDSTSVVPVTPLQQHDIDVQSWDLDLATPPSPPAPLSSPFAATTAPVPKPSTSLPPTTPTSSKLLHETFTRWLQTMTLHLPRLHETALLFPVLVSLGLAVQTADFGNFPALKARATTLVLKLCCVTAAASTTATAAATTTEHQSRAVEPSPEQQVTNLITWMLSHVIAADEELLGGLQILMQKAVEVKPCSGGERQRRSREQFLSQEAAVVADFFVAYAHVLGVERGGEL